MVKLVGESQDAAAELEDRVVGAYVRTRNRTRDQLNGMSDDAKGASADIVGGFVNGVPLILDSFEDIKAGMDGIKGDSKDSSEEVKADWGAAAKSIASTFQSTFDSVSQMVQDFYTADIEALQRNLDAKLEMIDANTQMQLESLGLAELTKAEMLQAELDTLQSQLNNTASVREQERLNDVIAAKSNELQKEQIVESGEKAKGDARKKAMKKQSKAEEKAFNAKKATDVESIWITAAIGVAGGLATGIAQMGPIPGAIAGAAAGTAILALAGAQTGVIASKNYVKPSFAVGTENAPGGFALVGERGPEIVNIPRGSSVTSAGQTEQAVSNGLGSIIIQTMTVIANNANDFKDSMIELQRFEGARV